MTSARSPWSQAANFKKAHVQPYDGAINAQLVVTGSKSYTNRALIIGALASGTSTIHGVLKSDDSYWCVDALQKLGISIEVNGDSVTMNGGGGAWPNKSASLFIGAAGTTARFLPGALASATEGKWRVDGIPQLRSRPLSPLIDALKRQGACIEYEADRPGLPLIIHGNGLNGGDVRIPGNVSSQFLSGLLIASPYARDEVRIIVEEGLVQPAYIGITLQLMRQFGAEVTASEDYREFVVQPKPYEGREVTLEADASTACYFLALAALSGGTVRVTNVGYNSHQPDAKLVDVFKKMGCTVEATDDYLQVSGPTQLRGGFDVDLKPMSDQALTIGALAPFADAPIRITNVGHIRTHESDRISVICSSLQKMGIQVDEEEDGFTVYPGKPNGAVLDPHDDHRNAMVFALMATKVPGITILDPGCVSKTCPTYFEQLKQFGIDVTLV